MWKTFGEPCSPYTLTKSVVTAEGEVTTQDVKIVGRKVSLLDVRQKLLHQHSTIYTKTYLLENR